MGRMPLLIVPSVVVAPSLREVAQTYRDEQHGDYGEVVAALLDDALPAYVDRLVADAHEGTVRPAGYVPSTHLWWADGDAYLGRVHIRHRLTPALRTFGGHIGYYVAPPYRRRGYATAMLAAALPVAAGLGIECALLTCDLDNVASRKVIEANGGLYWDEANGQLRYWLPTS
jgi:predicted acetyltransferase